MNKKKLKKQTKLFLMAVAILLMAGISLKCNIYAEAYEDNVGAGEYMEAFLKIENDKNNFVESNNKVLNFCQSMIENVKLREKTLLERRKREELYLQILEERANKEEISLWNIVVFNSNNISDVSNASEEQLEYVLKDTRLEGYGWLYKQLEEEYQINALFAISNSFVEAGRDPSFVNGYIRRNNIYGLLNHSFDSYEECIRYYFYMIDKYYIKQRNFKSISEVSNVYCPHTPDAWTDTITQIGNELCSRINKNK